MKAESRSLNQFIALSMLPLTVYSVQYQSRIDIGNTYFWWTVQMLLLILYYKSGSLYRTEATQAPSKWVNYYLFWNIVCIIRGLFIAETYWDWKGLVGNSFGLLTPIVFWMAMNPLKVQLLFGAYLRYAFPLFAVFAFVINKDVFGFYLVPFSFFTLFYPLLNLRWRIIIMAVIIGVIISDVGARSNVIRFGTPLILLAFYYLRNYYAPWFMEVVRKIMFFTPLVFLCLGFAGKFNIFQMENYMGNDYVQVSENAEGEMVESLLTADTRTPLYIEVLRSASDNNSWLFGRSPARGNASELFGDIDANGRSERLANEVGMLNIFTWTGLLGVVLYFLIFWRATYLAVNRSKSIFCRMLGIFIAFRWGYSWVEDINEFKLNYLLLWIMIGMCSSPSFRSFDDREVKRWIQVIFGRKGIAKRPYRHV